MKNYSVEYKLPAYIIRDSKYFTQDPSYVFQLVNIVQPVKNDGDQVYCHYLDGEHTIKSYSDLYGEISKKAILRLMHLDSDKNFQVVGEEIELGQAKQTMIKLSYCGRKLAIFTKCEMH